MSSRKLEDARLRVAIREINEEGEGKYGSPRIHDALLKRGFKVSRKRVIRLMKELNIRSKTIKKFKRTTLKPWFAYRACCYSANLRRLLQTQRG